MDQLNLATAVAVLNLVVLRMPVHNTFCTRRSKFGICRRAGNVLLARLNSSVLPTAVATKLVLITTVTAFIIIIF